MVTKNTTWESGIEILESMFVNIPISLLYVCNTIASKMNGDEFSILTKIEKIVDDEVWISPDYYIPEQEVATTTVDYLPDEEAHNYNVVIHRHPNGMNSFSSVDKEYINQNFELSLLYTQSQGFVNGVYNMKYGKFLIPIDVTPNVEYDIPEVNVSKIKKKTYVSSVRTTQYNYDDDWNKNWGRNEQGTWVKKNDKLQLPFTSDTPTTPSEDTKEDTKAAEEEILKKYSTEEAQDLQEQIDALYASIDSIDMLWNQGLGDKFSAVDIWEIESKIDELEKKLAALQN